MLIFFKPFHPFHCHACHAAFRRHSAIFADVPNSSSPDLLLHAFTPGPARFRRFRVLRRMPWRFADAFDAFADAQRFRASDTQLLQPLSCMKPLGTPQVSHQPHCPQPVGQKVFLCRYRLSHGSECRREEEHREQKPSRQEE